ncbi:MAG: hypothetical protein ACH346_07985, partial [Chthoniobacterales bacterium]
DAEEAWRDAAGWYKQALEKTALSHSKRAELINDTTKAEAAETFWKEKFTALSSQLPNRKPETKASLLKNLAKAQSLEQRTVYNKEVQRENNCYQQEKEALLITAQNHFIKACHDWDQAWSFSSKKQQAFDSAEQADDDLLKQRKAEAERLVLIPWNQQEAAERTEKNFDEMLITQKEQLEENRLNNLTPEQDETERRFKIARLKKKIVQLKMDKKQHDKNAAQARAAGKSEDAQSYSYASDVTSEVSSYLEKAIKALSDGKRKNATSLEEAAEESQQRIGLALLAIAYRVKGDEYSKNAKTTENNVDVERWEGAARAANYSAAYIEGSSAQPDFPDHPGLGAINCLKQAAEARARGDQKEAEVWTDGAKLYQKCAKYCSLIAEAYSQHNEPDISHLEQAVKITREAVEVLLKTDGKPYEGAINCLKQAAEARARGDEKEAEVWTDGAKLYQESAQYCSLAAEAYSQHNEPDVKHLEKAVDMTKAAVEVLLKTDGKSYEGAINCLRQATEARARGDEKEAEAWTEIARLRQEVAKYFSFEAKAWHKNDAIEAEYSDQAMQMMMSMGLSNQVIDSLKQATKAKEKGDEEMVKIWNDVARLRQESIKCYSFTAEAWRKNLPIEAKCWEKTASANENAAKMLEKIPETLKKATEAKEKGDEKMAEIWNEAARLDQESTNFYSSAAEALHNNLPIEAERWEKTASANANAAKMLEKIPKTLKKATEAKERGDEKMAEIWNEVARLDQESKTFYSSTAEAWHNGHPIGAERWEKTASANANAAEVLARAATTLRKIPANTRKVANARKVANTGSALDDMAKEYIERAAEAKAQGNEERAESWNKIARSIQKTAEERNEEEKALHEEEVRLSEAATLYQKSATYYSSAAEAWHNGYPIKAKELEEAADKAKKAANEKTGRSEGGSCIIL